jgi:hypothetical protein
MSIQLAVFPQTYLDNQLLVDGINFYGVNSATNTDESTASNLTLTLMQNNPPTIPNTWYKFRGTAYGTPAVATESGGLVTLNSSGVATGFGTRCGIYQRLSGLTIGDDYTAKIKFAAGQPNTVYLLRVFGDLTNYNYSLVATVSATELELTFTATATDDIIVVSYGGNSSGNLVISEMSVTNTAETVTQWEGQVIVDLYEDEEIPLTLSVDDFKNVAEKVQSYSKDFNLPATKRNNQIFGHLFEITRTVADPYGFNPYLRTRAVLKENGIIIFDGMLKLIDIQNRDGEISYNVNLFSETIALADTLKNRTFDYIDFSELEHEYNITNIKNSWDDDVGLPLDQPLNTASSYAYDSSIGANNTNVLKYPFVDWTGQILYANGSTQSSATLGMPELTSLEQAFRPWIQIKYLVDRIFSEAGYTYSSAFFDSSDFKKLFMDFNWGGDRMPTSLDESVYHASQGFVTPFLVSTTGEPIQFYPAGTSGVPLTSILPPDYNTSGADQYSIVSTADNQLYNVDYSIPFRPNSGSSADGVFVWEHYDASTGTTNFIDLHYEFNIQFYGQIWKYEGQFYVTLDTGDKLTPKMQDIGVSNTLKTWYGGTAVFTISTVLVTSSILNTLRGQLNQWEFLKGIMTMFNLITLKDEDDPGNIIIEPYKDVFIKTTSGLSLSERNINHDWTKKIDEKDITLKPLNDLKKKTIFKYAEDDGDFMFNVYKRSTRGHLYGSKIFDATQFTLLEGEEEVVAEPFAATVSKPLWTAFPEFVVPTIYTADDNGVTSSFDNAPRILYQLNDEAETMGTSSYYIPAQNGGAAEQTFKLFTFAHLTTIPTVVSTPPAASDTVDFNFGECQLINPIGVAVPNNLFNTYWLPYYNQLYNPDTKIMTLKAYLQPSDIATFKFTDYVMIQNRSYRVNRIDYKSNNLSTVEFILIV